MTEQPFVDLVEQAGSRSSLGHVPVQQIPNGTAKGRRLRARTLVAVTAAGVALVVLSVTLVGRSADTTSTTPSSAASGPAHDAASSIGTTSRPPRPGPVTMQTVRHFGHAQEFRAHTGAVPPAISEAEALRRAEGQGDYSLGLWDVGLLHEDSTVDWQSVWIIADETYLDDHDKLSLGGPMNPNKPASPHEPRPGWARSVTMLDATTGKFVMAIVF